jgi:hypothetical protein
VRFVCAYSFNQVTIEGSQLMLKLVTGGANAFLAMRLTIFDVGGDVKFGATVRARGRESVFVHTSHLHPPIKYLIIMSFWKRVSLKNLKKKEKARLHTFLIP